MRLTWKGRAALGCENPSLPQLVTMYLLAQIRGVSRASEESCSCSSDTRWPQRGTSSTFAFLRPRSKMRTWHRRHHDRREIGPACCYNTGNTGWGGAQGDTRTFSGAPKGEKDVRLFKRVSCFLFFLSSAEFPNRVIPVDNRLFSPRQTVSCKGLPRSLTIPLEGRLSGRSMC